MIEPALTSEEWAAGPRFAPLSCEGLVIHDDGDGLEFVTYDNGTGNPLTGKYKIDAWDADGIAGVIAVANHCLPDPRKITREDVNDLRKWIEELTEHNSVADANSGHLRKIADALESYLPPA